ncbi:MAG: hypothetical protein JXQ90_06205 [Cyclobacteriaceae bacterium]
MRAIILLIILSGIGQMSMAHPTSRTSVLVTTESFQRVKVIVNGHPVNRIPSHSVTIDWLRPGEHHVQVQVYGKYNINYLEDYLFVAPGVRTELVVSILGKYGRMGLRVFEVRGPGHHHRGTPHRTPSYRHERYPPKHLHGHGKGYGNGHIKHDKGRDRYQHNGRHGVQENSRQDDQRDRQNNGLRPGNTTYRGRGSNG